MSDAAETNTLLSAAGIDRRAADYVQRRHLWDWSGEDQAELDGWIAQSLAHRAAYLQA